MSWKIKVLFSTEIPKVLVQKQREKKQKQTQNKKDLFRNFTRNYNPGLLQLEAN